MIILRLSPGQSNQMLEFAAGYALAQERGEELVLDISTCLDSVWGYQLDYFNIPALPKLLYDIKDVSDSSHTVSSNIPPSLLASGKAYSDVNPELLKYADISQSQELEGDPVILCGYFFSRHYYAKYWDDVRSMFVPAFRLPTLEHFVRLSEGYESVGIHIRRGDFLVTDWAFKPEDNFFRAAVCWYRKKLSKPRFFVFSDDIEYARTILGVDSSIYYVHPLGGNEGPLAEFLCLSRCQHMVLSNSSTFSELAWQLNNFSQKRVVRRGRQAQLPLKARLKKKLRRLLPLPETEECIMDAEDVNAWAKNYASDGINPLAPYGEKIRKALACSDDRQAIDIIDQIGMNVAELTAEDRKAVGYRKFTASVRLCELDQAFDLAASMWFQFDECPDFHERYLKILLKANFFAEAAVEAARCTAQTLVDSVGFQCLPDSMKRMHDIFSASRKHCFLLTPFASMRASSKPVGLVQLGLVLRRLGHEVCFLLKTGTGPDEDHGETAYINNNTLLTTRTGVCLGCKQVRYEDVLETPGLAKMIQACDGLEGWAVVVSHDPAVCQAAHRMGRPFIFGGLSQNDPEHAVGHTIEAPLRSFMERQAAYILPDAEEAHDAYSVSSERWAFRQERRLPVREIYRAAALLERLASEGWSQ